MPPDRGPVMKTQKTDLKKENKLSTPRRDRKPGDVTSRTKVDVKGDVTSRTKEDAKGSRDSSLSRQRTKVKEGETISVPGKVSKSSRVDAAKLMDVKKDLDKDLKKAKEILGRNRTVRNLVTKPAATRAGVFEKSSSNSSVNRRSSNDSLGARKVAVVSSSSKKVLQTSTVRTKSSNLANEVSSSPKSKIVRNVDKQRTFDRPSREDRQSRLKQQSSETRVKHSERQTSSEKHLSQDKQPKKLSRERTRTRTLSPHEVKMAKSNSSFEIQSGSKASTSTYEPADNAPSRSEQTKSPTAQDPRNVGGQSTDDGNNDYEDDFEDYESDFEEDVPEESSDETSNASELASENEDTSVDDGNASGDEIVEITSRPVVEEEKKLDSGNYDLTESKRKGREMQKIKEALEKENADISAHGAKRKTVDVPVPVARDEGFEEDKADAVTAHKPLKNAVIINFASAKRKMEEQKVSAKAKKRGEELLAMIRMDVVNFSLLDLPPVPYDVYIKSYGRSNNQQVSVQTNEDDLTEETQTEEIFSQNKWTQYPIAYQSYTNTRVKDPSLLMLSQDHVGCGGDSEGDPDQWKTKLKYDAVRLNKFLLNAGQAIAQFLDDQSDVQEKDLMLNQSASFLSSGYFNLNVNSVPCLAGRFVSRLYFSEFRPTTILTVHQQLDNTPETLHGKCILCIWNILRPHSPGKILVCSNNVTSACFHQTSDHLVFGGLCEGTVCVWDLQEPSTDHYLGENVCQDLIIRSPTYSTAEILKNNGHLTEVSAISAIRISEPDPQSVESNLGPIQVCSIEVAGLAIVWTVIQNPSSAVKTGLILQDLGIAFWGKVQLVRSIVINIFEGLDLNNSFLSNVQCRDMIIDPVDPSHFYVCTNSGHVIHCLSSGCKPQPKIYFSSEAGFVPASCIANLVDHQYMLVGFEGGTVELFGRKSSKSLTKFAGTGDVFGQGPAVRSIEASSTHPGQFFVLDATSRIHVWNLIESDILPIKSLSLGKMISTMKLSRTNGNKPLYLAIATMDGEVELYQTKPEFGCKLSSEFEDELQGFRAYAKEL